MKILGTANIRDYCGIVCGKGLVVDCTEEEFKETGNMIYIVTGKASL